MRNEDIFEKAVEALKNEDTPSGPPRELVDATIASLAEASEQSDTVNFEKRIRIRDKLLTGNRLARIAAAAVSQPPPSLILSSFGPLSSRLSVET